MSENVLIITVPIPKHNVNKVQRTAKIGSFHKKKDVENAKASAQKAMSELQCNYGLPWANATIHVRWFHPTKNLRDRWNCVACLKGTVDGIVRQGVLVDDDLIQPPTVERLVDKNNPRVELYIVEFLGEAYP